MALAAKLQLKPGQGVNVIDVPPSLAPLLTGLNVSRVACPETAFLIFAVDRSALEDHRAAIADSATQDRLTWVAYPKAGQLNTDLNRDSLAATLEEHGIEPVRQVAIDEVWSALRFRPLRKEPS